jgi:T-complex protein 1 subunit alpha
MSSKIIGASEDFFARIAVDAALAVRREEGADGVAKYPISSINILKTHGKSSTEVRQEEVVRSELCSPLPQQQRP